MRGAVVRLAAIRTRAPVVERGQATVEWVGLLLLTALVLLALLAAGVAVPGASLARAMASRILCAAAIAESCGGGEPAVIAAYGSEVGAIVRDEMPSLVFEHGSRALPVDFRSCRETSCGDGSEAGLVARSDAGLPVTAFVHVIDCREGGLRPAGADCSGDRQGNLYIQYWTYYADSATLRGVPVAGSRGYHRDDWESVQFRIGPDGDVSQRASSHHGYNYAKGWRQRGLRRRHRPAARPRGGCRRTPAGRLGTPQRPPLRLRGSHAGNVEEFPSIDRMTPGSRVHLIPLEPIAAGSGARFAISPPWSKAVWLDPEAEGTE